MQKICAVRYKAYEMHVDVGDTVYDIQELNNIVDGIFDQLLTNTAEGFTVLLYRTYSLSLPSWGFSCTHPDYGTLLAVFTDDDTVSAWKTVPWEPPAGDAWKPAPDSYSDFFDLESCVIDDIWNVTYQYHYEFNPPFIWSIKYHKIQYHYKNFVQPLVSLPTLLTGVSAFLLLNLLGMPQSSRKKPKLT